MDIRVSERWIVWFAMVCMAGCTTPAALRRQTVGQGGTVADIHQQQVLDNLAKFVADPYAIPSFAVAATGSTQVNDSGEANLDLGWISTGFDAVGLSFGGSRSHNDSWTTTPITDPRKLELMRCAYQRATSQCTGMPESACCPDCRQRFNEFYTGRSVSTRMEKDGSGKDVVVYQCDGAGRVANLVPQPCQDSDLCSRCGKERADMAGCAPTLPPPADPDNRCYCNERASSGIASVNSECLNAAGGCWLCYGCKKCVPKECGYVGHYCGTYVWVPPGPGRDELAKLTLAILDYAVHDDRQLPAKEVTAYLSANGVPATSSTAAYVVKATIGAHESSASVARADLPSPAVTQSLQSQADALRETLRSELNVKPGRPLNLSTRMQALAQSERTAAEKQAVEETFSEYQSLRRDIQALNRVELAPPLEPLPQQLTPVPNTNLLYLQQQLNTVR